MNILEAPACPPRPKWKKTLWAVWAAELLAIAGFGTSTPIIPFYLQDLGIHDPVRISFFTGLIAALPSLMLAFFAPIWGSLADSFGRKPMLLRAMLGGAVILFLQGVVRDPWQLLVLRTLQGCVTGTVAAATVLVASISPKEEAGGSLGLLQMAIFLGSSLGPMFGGAVSDLFGHRVNFFATSVLLLAAGIIVWRLVDDDFVRPAERRSLLKSMLPDFSPLARNKALWALLAVVAADQIAGSITAPFLPLFIQNITPSAALVSSMTGLILGLGALASAGAAAALGKVSYRIGYRRTLVICMVAAAAFTLPQAFVRSPFQLLVLRILSCFFIGGDMPAVNALIAQRAERGRQGSVYGLSSSVASGSNALGPAIGTAIAAGSQNYGAVFFATAGILAAAGASIAAFLRRGRAFPAD
jgi:DHA1 family multidrug resistance protein-like MFS transporter